MALAKTVNKINYVLSNVTLVNFIHILFHEPGFYEMSQVEFLFEHRAC